MYSGQHGETETEMQQMRFCWFIKLRWSNTASGKLHATLASILAGRAVADASKVVILGATMR